MAFPYQRNDIVLARVPTGNIYYVKIKSVSLTRKECLAEFDDGSVAKVDWANIFDVRAETDIIVCVVCKKGESEKPNEIILCDTCNVGYHQKCHPGPITDTHIAQEKWYCYFCTRKVKNPYISNPFKDASPRGPSKRKRKLITPLPKQEDTSKRRKLARPPRKTPTKPVKCPSKRTSKMRAKKCTVSVVKKTIPPPITAVSDEEPGEAPSDDQTIVAELPDLKDTLSDVTTKPSDVTTRPPDLALSKKQFSISSPPPLQMSPLVKQHFLPRTLSHPPPLLTPARNIIVPASDVIKPASDVIKPASDVIIPALPPLQKARHLADEDPLEDVPTTSSRSRTDPGSDTSDEITTPSEVSRDPRLSRDTLSDVPIGNIRPDQVRGLYLQMCDFLQQTRAQGNTVVDRDVINQLIHYGNKRIQLLSEAMAPTSSAEGGPSASEVMTSSTVVMTSSSEGMTSLSGVAPDNHDKATLGDCSSVQLTDSDNSKSGTNNTKTNTAEAPNVPIPSEPPSSNPESSTSGTRKQDPAPETAAAPSSVRSKNRGKFKLCKSGPVVTTTEDNMEVPLSPLSSPTERKRFKLDPPRLQEIRTIYSAIQHGDSLIIKPREAPGQQCDAGLPADAGLPVEFDDGEVPNSSVEIVEDTRAPATSSDQITPSQSEAALGTISKQTVSGLKPNISDTIQTPKSDLVDTKQTTDHHVEKPLPVSSRCNLARESKTQANDNMKTFTIFDSYSFLFDSDEEEEIEPKQKVAKPFNLTKPVFTTATNPGSMTTPASMTTPVSKTVSMTKPVSGPVSMTTPASMTTPVSMTTPASMATHVSMTTYASTPASITTPASRLASMTTPVSRSALTLSKTITSTLVLSSALTLLQNCTTISSTSIILSGSADRLLHLCVGYGINLSCVMLQQHSRTEIEVGKAVVENDNFKQTNMHTKNIRDENFEPNRVSSKKISGQCYNCYSAARISCRRCASALYCSSRCELEHSAIHRRECFKRQS